MSNYNWSLRYPVSSIKLKEDKLAKPFYHEEEEKEEEEGVEQFIKDGALKQKGNHILATCLTTIGHSDILSLRRRRSNL
jgi:hypothetical protein